MHIGKFGLLLVLTGSLLSGCSDSSDSRGGQDPTEPPEPPEPPQVSLDETGIYSGTLETDEGDVALMRIKLARDGATAISLQEDDSEQATTILWGESDGSGGNLTFSGRDLGSGGSVSVDLQFSEDSSTGRLELGDLNGDFSLTLEDISANSSDLATLSGEYARTDPIPGQSLLSVSADGTIELSGDCASTGTASVIDPEVNLYRFSLQSDCLTLDALISLEAVETDNDLVSLTGDDDDQGVAVNFYRI